MVEKILIFHFYPIEGYPPVQNLLDTIGKQKNIRVECITTCGPFHYKWKNKDIKVKRLGCSSSTGNFKSIKLYISYLLFNIGGFFFALIYRPKTILYYETISALPAWLYKKVYRKSKVMVHYHEYTSTAEYKKGPMFTRLIHHFEIKNYSGANWISHTNLDRLQLFCKDYQLEGNEQFHVLPNFPPEYWKSVKKQGPRDSTMKLVYVGYSLSDNTMYASEIITWAANHKDNITLDFYLLKTPQQFLELKDKLQGVNIGFNNAVTYSGLPNILTNYDVGLILYKGSTLNYKYNAPNKLFEYWACGLDTWFPKEMVGPVNYITSNAFPKIIPVDFNNLVQFDWQSAINKTGHRYMASQYFCEGIYNDMVGKMSNINA
jgi:hypothetical protein